MRAPWLPFVALTLIPRDGATQGDPVGPEFRVNTYTTDYQRSGSVAADSSGNFVVIWESQSQDGSAWGIFGRRYAAAGIPLGSEFRVNSYTTSYQWMADVASDSSGNFVVVWADDYFPQPRGVFGQRYASNGVPLGSEFRVNTYTPFQTNSPSIARDSSGNFVVVWASQYQDGSGSGVFGQRYDSTGNPLGSEFRVNAYTTSNQIDPSVAAGSSGDFVVVWESATQDGSGSGVFGQRYASTGVPLGSEFRINTYTTGGQGVCAVSSDSSGNLVVVWTSYAQDGSNSGVFGQRFVSSGVPLGPEFRINTHTTDSQGAPTVASDAAGNFVVIWSSQQDGSLNGIVGQRFDSSGSPLGPEFRANAYTTGAQSLPSVASDPSGNFIVVWTSDAQDGSSGGIFSQRYNQIVPVELMRFGVE